MPINSSIPLQARGIDPNAFTNSLAQILQIQQAQRSGQRQDMQDEQAQAATNSLSQYINRTEQDPAMRELGMGSPAAYQAVSKNKAAAAKTDAETEKAKLSAYAQKLEFLTQITSSFDDEPSYQAARQEAEKMGPGSTDGWPRHFDAKWQAMAIKKGTKYKDQAMLKLREQDTASKIKYRDSMQGQPMVMTGPGGTYTAPQNDPMAATRVPMGPSSAEQAEANQQFQLERDESLAKSRLESRQQLAPAQLANVKNKLQTIGLLKEQVQNIRSKFRPLKGTFSAGLGGDYIPTEGGQSFDAAVSALSPILRQLTRTPGEGAMSDYEAKLAEAMLPSRGKYEAVTEQQIGQIEGMIKQLENGYMGMLPGAGQTKVEPGMDPGMTLEQIDAELKRRGAR